jgi:hypothetical protein
MSIEKDCPFCGGSLIHETQEDTAVCDVCGATAPLWKWNERAAKAVGGERKHTIKDGYCFTCCCKVWNCDQEKAAQPSNGAGLEKVREALTLAKGRIQYLAAMLSDNRHHASNEQDFLPAINEALAELSRQQTAPDNGEALEALQMVENNIDHVGQHPDMGEFARRVRLYFPIIKSALTRTGGGDGVPYGHCCHSCMIWWTGDSNRGACPKCQKPDEFLVEDDMAMFTIHAPTPLAADGFKLVPIEPTLTMLTALHNTAWPQLSNANRERPLRDGYAAMLSAAPQPPAVGDE